jgi:hypothetical protein
MAASTTNVKKPVKFIPIMGRTGGLAFGKVGPSTKAEQPAFRSGREMVSSTNRRQS